MKKNIIIIGSRGYQFSYGGWETFVTNYVDNADSQKYQFYIPTLTFAKEQDMIIHKPKENLESINIYSPKNSFTTMFFFTIKSIKYYVKYIQEKKLSNCKLIILGCKIGPLMPLWFKKLHKLGVKVIMNPDGLEWKRDKWPWWVKQCFKISERYSVKYSDMVVCDSKAIQEYIDKKYDSYKKPSYFIAYGAYLDSKGKKNEQVKELFKKNNIKEKNYYLIVGRFIPENNYETMIKEFMKSNSQKDLVIICNLEHNDFYQELLEKTNFKEDKRIKFVGSFYDQEGLIYIRENAYCYLHGHSAGGTNPSLLEALSRTSINLLFDVAYNKEVGLDSCFYFTKEEDNLRDQIDKIDKLSTKEIEEYESKAKKRIKDEYTWNIVVNKYNKLFNDKSKNN